MPFLAWTIAPYWTTNLLYAGSFFLCRTGAELVAHARRLLTVQVVCVACFLVVPLQFSWAKPASPGAYGWLYAALGSFDKPYNQAPSLHVALTVVLAALYLGRVPRWLQFSFAAWSGLIVASVMTTFQHHFIDIPTGVLAGLVCVWVWPLDGARRVLVGCGTRGALLAWRYAAGALVCAGFAAAWRGSWLWLLWPAFSLLCVALGYRCFGTQVFDKRSDGRLPWTSSAMLLPYLVAARINSRLWTRGSARCVAVADGVWIGRFPGAGDANGFATVVDLTAEMWTPRTTAAWRSFPMLDLVAPEPAALVAAASGCGAGATTRARAGCLRAGVWAQCGDRGCVAGAYRAGDRCRLRGGVAAARPSADAPGRRADGGDSEGSGGEGCLKELRRPTSLRRRCARP